MSLCIITDAQPGGFADDYTPTIATNALRYAQDAAANHIQINAIQIGYNSDAQFIMTNYAGISSGWYTQLGYGTSVNDIEAAILNMLYTPGNTHPVVLQTDKTLATPIRSNKPTLVTPQ